MAQTPEGKVKDAVKRRLRALNVALFSDVPALVAAGKQVDGCFYMPVAGPFSTHGVHDFVGCWHGVFWSIETKAPDNPEDATHHQQMFHEAVRTAGGISMVGVRHAAAVDMLHDMINERLKGLK